MRNAIPLFLIGGMAVGFVMVSSLESTADDKASGVALKPYQLVAPLDVIMEHPRCKSIKCQLLILQPALVYGRDVLRDHLIRHRPGERLEIRQVGRWYRGNRVAPTHYPKSDFVLYIDRGDEPETDATRRWREWLESSPRPFVKQYRELPHIALPGGWSARLFFRNLPHRDPAPK